ncbi:MAG: ABC transporter ATP-binding protein, partial [Isosphaeraceae bacterium]
MQADAYRRARTHMGSHSDLIVARVLGAIQSFLLLGLLGIICLFVALMASRGEVRFPRAEAARLPAWVANQGVPDGALLRFQNTGIFPLVANNLLDLNPAHRAGAWLVDRISAV